MQRLIFLSILLFLLFSQKLHSQDVNIDSLTTLIDNYPKVDKQFVEINLKIAKEYLVTNDKTATIYGEKALQASKQLSYYDGEIESLLTLGEYYISIHPDQALMYFEDAVTAAYKSTDRKLIAKSLNKAGRFYQIIHYFDKAKESLEKSLQISKELELHETTISNLNNLGIIYKKESDFTKAEYYYLQAQNFALMYHDDKKTCEILNNLGLLQKSLGNYSKAIEFELKALALSEKINYKNVSSSCLNNIGIIYQKQHNYKLAIKYFKRSLKIAKELNNYRIIAKIYNNEGIIYLKQKNYHKAMICLNHAIVINKKIGNENGLSSNLKNIGSIQLEKGNFERAIKTYEEALAIDIKYNNTKKSCLSLLGLSQIYLMMNNYEKALDYSNRGLKIADSLGLLAEQATSHNLLSSIYNNKKEFEKAFKHLIIYKNLTDSLFNLKSIKEISELENNYKYTKEKEIQKHKQMRHEAIQKEKNKRDSLIKTGLTTGIIILLILVFLLISIFINKRNANKILNKKNKEIVEQKNQILRQKEQLQVQAKGLLNTQEHLEEKVLHKTADLIVAKNKAEESDRLKMAFLNNISHEFRTPMNGILGFSNLITDESLTKEERLNCTNYIKKSCTQLLNIVNDTVEISKVHSELIQVDNSAVNLKSILQELIAENQDSIKEKKIEFESVISLKDENQLIRTDDKKLRRILWHLMDNAIKFTFQGYIKLSVIQTDDEVIEITMKDNGIGIPDDLQKIIFEPFRQAEVELSKSHGGTGVGLSLTKAYVDIMGGSIDLKSEQGKGTTISIKLPYIVEEFEGKKTEVLQTTNLKNKTILVAEDDEMNFLLVKEILTRLNINIIHAWNGEEAIKLFKENSQINLVLMDIKMPVMNGYEATKAIKEINPKIPVIAHSAHISKIRSTDKSFNIFDGLIAKPLIRKSFIETIKKAL